MIVLGHVPYELEPVKPLNAVKLMQLLVPYADKLMDCIGDEFFNKLFMFFLNLTENPQLALQIYALLANVEFQWLIDNADTEELVASFPVINVVNQGLLQFFYEMIYFMAMLNVKPESS